MQETTSMGICYNCHQAGHWASQCPALKPSPTTTGGKPGLTDNEIRWRIQRFYFPASDAEMTGLISTWKENYKPGVEYPEAPRYPPGFLVLLGNRASERAGRPPNLRVVTPAHDPFEPEH